MISENGRLLDRFRTTVPIQLTATFYLECCMRAVFDIVVFFRFMLHYVCITLTILAFKLRFVNFQ